MKASGKAVFLTRLLCRVIFQGFWRPFVELAHPGFIWLSGIQFYPPVSWELYYVDDFNPNGRLLQSSAICNSFNSREILPWTLSCGWYLTCAIYYRFSFWPPCLHCQQPRFWPRIPTSGTVNSEPVPNSWGALLWALPMI